MAATSNPSVGDDALAAEVRWHYSTSFFAESLGEDVLSEILAVSDGTARITSLLRAHIQDERRHAGLYKTTVNKTGVEPGAAGYANAYANLVRAETQFCKKVFIFHVLTETVASEFVQWRINSIGDEALNSVDREVHRDELRHLGFARPLLSQCDPDQLKEELSDKELRRLASAMIKICKASMETDLDRHLGLAAIEQPLSEAHFSRRKHYLDTTMPRRILEETRLLSSFVGR